MIAGKFEKRPITTVAPMRASSVAPSRSDFRRVQLPPRQCHTPRVNSSHLSSASASEPPACIRRRQTGGNCVPRSSHLSVNKAGGIHRGHLDQKKHYIVGTMERCGLIYEEVARQLLATGSWTRTHVRQRAITKSFFALETQRDLCDETVHLLLGEKTPMERLIRERRNMCARLARVNRNSIDAKNKLSRYGSFSLRPIPALRSRIPMGSNDDGVPRVIDYVENLHCLTLKSSMVSTLLDYHHNNWDELGLYTPRTYHLVSQSLREDEREQLKDTVRGAGRKHMWIAKSSYGCHGDNIEIFSGDASGVAELLKFVDGQTRASVWVAQQYIDYPLLYHKRKFDVRCWVLFLRNSNQIFMHESLVMRTSSVIYDRDTATSRSSNARLCHITNHSVQKESKFYSKYEEGNELWREHLDGLVRFKATKLLESEETTCDDSDSRHTTGMDGVPDVVRWCLLNGNVTLRSAILPQFSKIIVNSILAAQKRIPPEPDSPPTHTFQLLGYDFLIDDRLKVWLLEINGAPGGAEHHLPQVAADVIDLAISPFFPTASGATKRRNGFTKIFPR